MKKQIKYIIVLSMILMAGISCKKELLTPTQQTSKPSLLIHLHVFWELSEIYIPMQKVVHFMPAGLSFMATYAVKIF